MSLYQVLKRFSKTLLTLVLLCRESGLQAHRPFSQTSTDSSSNLLFLLFLVAFIVLFFAPVICLIIAFFSRKARPAWFFVPFTITALFGLFHITTGSIDYAIQGKAEASFYFGSVYVGLALVALIRYLRKGSKPTE